MEFKHKSVLLDESIEALKIRPDGIYVDGTLGGGGHSYEICRRLSDRGKLIGIDQDAAAIEAAGERLGEFKDKTIIIRANYGVMKKELDNRNITSGEALFWIWAYPPISWIRQTGASLTGRMHRWICGWISARQ